MEESKIVKFKPITDRLVIEPDPVEEKTASGLFIPESAKEKPRKGTILAVGQGRYVEQTGELIPSFHKVGDRVIYAKNSGTEVEDGGKTYLIMRESDIFATI